MKNLLDILGTIAFLPRAIISGIRKAAGRALAKVKRFLKIAGIVLLILAVLCAVAAAAAFAVQTYRSAHAEQTDASDPVEGAPQNDVREQTEIAEQPDIPEQSDNTEQADVSEPAGSTEQTDISEPADTSAQDGNQKQDTVSGQIEPPEQAEKQTDSPERQLPLTLDFDLSSVPEYSGEPYAVMNGNVPYFADEELMTVSCEYYSPLDELGRCGLTAACIGIDIMPTEERGDISTVTPSGWDNAEYDFIENGWLYNRCHLIGWQLTAEDANERNLITGTRYMNTEGMLPFENETADCVRDGLHVVYRVTPVYDGENLVASGVLMEAMSAEDRGGSLEFCVFCYNVQPGIVIDYSTGASSAS